MQKKRKQENRREDEGGNNLDGCRSSYTDNLDPALKTNTVDPHGFGLAAANPGYWPHSYPEGSPEMNKGASGVHWA